MEVERFSMDNRMTIAEVIDHLNLNKQGVRTHIGMQSKIKAAEVNLAVPISCSEVKELSDKFPSHRKRIVISLEQDASNPIVHILGNWEATDLAFAGKALKHTADRYRSSLRTGVDYVNGRRGPTAEEIKQAKAEDFERSKKGLEIAAERSV